MAEAKRAADKMRRKDPYFRSTYAFLKGQSLPPLLFAKRTKIGPNSEPLGSVTALPEEVDQAARDAWLPFFQGNIEDLSVHTTNFICKYNPFLFKAPEFQVEPVSGQDLYDLCTIANKNSVGGLDGWSPADWSILPLEVLVLLALLFNAIEEGADWPADSLNAKAAFLAKDENPSLDPLGYLIVFIFPILYRRWAAVRLKKLEPMGSTMVDARFFCWGPRC